MASTKNITMKQYNGTDYDTLYPVTIASQIISGTLSADRIPNLAASKITSGTFDAARIPTLAASKITSRTFAATGIIAMTGTDYTTYRIRNLAANTSDITAGSTTLSSGNIYLVYE